MTFTGNTAPVAVGDSYSTNEDTPLTVAAQGVLTNDTDADGDTLTAALVAGPSHAQSFVLNTDGSFSYTPAPEYTGSDSFTYRANDGTVDSNIVTVTLTIAAVNDAPSFAKGADQTVLEDAPAQTIAGWATAISAGGNESGQTLTFTATNDNTALFSAQPAIAANGTLTFTPAANANGSATVTVTLKDNGGTANGGLDTSAPQTFMITVTPVNDAPSFTKGGNQTVDEDAGAQSVPGWATSITAGPSNESSQVLDFLVSNTNNALFTVQPAVAADGTLTFTSAPDAFGTATVTVQIHDNGGTADGGDDTSDAQTFTITVNPVNDAPVLASIGDTTVDEQTPLSFTATATDVDSAELTFSLDPGAPAGAGITPAGAFTWTPGEADGPGTFTITIRVSDNGTPVESDTETITITVDEVNVAPVLDAIGPKSGAWGNAITFTASASDADIPANALTFSLDAGAPSGAAISPSSGAFSWTPVAGDVGAHTITVRVTDNGSPTRDDAETITVTVTRRATTLVYNGTLSATYNTTASLSATLTDNGGGALQGTPIAGRTVTFTLGAQSASAATNASGVASASLTLAQNAGSYTVASSFATDAAYFGSIDSDPFTITQAAQAIAVTTGAPASAVFGTSFTVAATGGGSGNPVVYSATGGCTNAGATFTMTSGVVACTVHYNQAGDINYTAAPEVTQAVAPIGYAMTGFFAPIDMSTVTTRVWNKANAGQAIPAKWRLTLAGVPVSATSSFLGLFSFDVACDSGSGDVTTAIEEYAAGNSSLIYKGDGNFQFDWKTPKSYANTCKAMYVQFADGSRSAIAYFKFR